MFENLIGKKNFSVERLVTLCRVVEAGSIRAAAGSSPSQQSQSSRQITELQKFLGIDLLDKHSKPYDVTELAKELSQISKDYLSALDGFVATCQNRPVKLVIGAGGGQIQWLLIPGALPRLNKIPKTSVIFKNLQTEGIIGALQNGDIDIGLVRKNAIPKTLTSFGKLRVGYRLFIPKDRDFIPKKSRPHFGTHVHLPQIKDIPMAVLEGEGQFRRILTQLSNDAGVELNLKVECSSGTQVALMVARKECCAILPESAKEQLNESEVDNYEVQGFEELERTLCVAWNPQRAKIRPMIEEAAKLMIGGISRELPGKDPPSSP